MPVLVLLNGAPGVGKSSVAALLVGHRPLMLALDVDVLKHALGRWDDDPVSAGRHARRLALALIREQLASGHDVVVPQYLARTEFICDLESACADSDSRFVELVLVVDSSVLAERLDDRRVHPDRPEHAVNNVLVAPSDAPRLVGSVGAVLAVWPRATRIDASGPLAETLAQVLAALDRPDVIRPLR